MWNIKGKRFLVIPAKAGIQFPVFLSNGEIRRCLCSGITLITCCISRIFKMTLALRFRTYYIVIKRRDYEK